MCPRSRLTASPPFCPAWRASAVLNSCAVPCWCAARPPSAAIARCRSLLMPATPRRLFEPGPLLDGRRAEEVRLPDEDLLRPPADLERLAVRRDADVEDRPDCPRDLAERD